MLTRLEIDGFKTFDQFRMDFSPLQVILGPNASGKSNLFDAITLLSHLAEDDVGVAFSKVRGQPYELFRRQPDGLPGAKMAFAVEVLLDRNRADPWGTSINLKYSRLRYELELERRADDGRLERLVVVRERAVPVKPTEDRWQPGGESPSRAFRDHFYIRGRGAEKPFLDVTVVEGQRTFTIREGKRKTMLPADEVSASVLSSITSGLDFPHLYALRAEFQSWRVLQLDPAALHEPSFISDPDFLEPSGRNLAKVLARIRNETATDHQQAGDLADLIADLAGLVPGLLHVNVREEEGKYHLDFATKEGQPFSSRVVSDGTLRALALLAVLYDPRGPGVVCFEEPENGIHPARLKALIKRLGELVTDPHQDEVGDTPLSQLILSSHSPVVLSCRDRADMVFFDMVTVTNPATENVARKTRVRPLLKAEPNNTSGANGREYVASYEVERYLCSVRDEG